MAQGYNAHADVLTRTADGRDLNQLWTDYQQMLAEYNSQRQTMVDFLVTPVTNPTEIIAQPGQGGEFEEASEYGVPKGIRASVDHYTMGFPFKWYDLAARFTWQFLADATTQQVDAIQAAAIEADSRLVFNSVMRRLFNNQNSYASINGQAYNVYAFYNGDGTTPPPYRTNTFTGSHTHYITTGTAVVEAQDLDDLIGLVTEHGYTPTQGYRVVVMVNKAEAQTIRAFRSAASNDGVRDATHGDWDFIPSQGTPAMYLEDRVTLLGGPQVSNNLNGLNVIGSYGDVLIVQDDYVPAGYLVCFATGGPQNLQNPIGMRQHPNAALQGMRLVKGPNPDYPLIDSYYVRGFGLGIRHRGAGAVLQVTTNETYSPPTTYA